MSDVQVGDVRQEEGGDTYVITASFTAMWGETYFSIICTDGDVVESVAKGGCAVDKLLAHYDNWITAVNSKEFRNSYEKWKDYDA